MLFNKLFKKASNEEFGDIAPKTTKCFTEVVDFLKSTFPNKKINKLGELTWYLVCKKITPFALAKGVDKLSFYSEYEKEEKIGIILCPTNWAEKLEKDLIYNTGGVVFIGSQLIDYFNNKIDENTLDRAKAYEAEYILTVLKINKNINLNQWQKETIEKFPKGLESLDKNLIYKSKEIDDNFKWN